MEVGAVPRYLVVDYDVEKMAEEIFPLTSSKVGLKVGNARTARSDGNIVAENVPLSRVYLDLC